MGSRRSPPGVSHVADAAEPISIKQTRCLNINNDEMIAGLGSLIGDIMTQNRQTLGIKVIESTNQEPNDVV